ncbi:hypothetical protein WJX84_012396 [Apatococcus fuscideae]|uniref:Succinate dehydrogenase assembly factor 2, mitochondrial n=1 Tax=Apatococcus fuscideae TaxID=2026836 RepID=A0AAW1SKA0_9CHLO
MLRSLVSQARWYSAAAEPQQGSVDTIFNEKSSAAPAPEPAGDSDSARRQTLARLMYRAKQRGWLEMDLLVGLWAERNLPTAEPPMLTAFEVLLDEENPDLLKWLTGQLEPPTALTKNPAFVAIYKDTQKQLGDHTLDKANAAGNREWIRGWDDWSRTDEQPNTAAAEAVGTTSPDK